MELQISYRLYTEVSQTNNLQANIGGYRANNQNVMRPERNRNNRAAAMPDHIHLYVTIPPKYSVSAVVGYLKGKSSLMIFDRHANLKYKYGSRHFWCRGYYVDTVGKNKKAIEEYIRNQLVEDEMMDQMTIKEYTDPFTGSKNSKA